MIISRNKTVVKVLIALFFSFFVLINIFAIEEKEYKDMTDRDRILLAVSYYEVSMKYEALNNKALANSYRKEALKIEKDVEKYFKGELEVPKKTIEIDWNSIFTSDKTSDEQEPVAEEDDDDDEEEYLEEDLDDEDLFADIDEDTSDAGKAQESDNEGDLFGDIYGSDNTSDSKPAESDKADSDFPQEDIVDLPAETLSDENASSEEADTEDWIVGEKNDLDPTITISQIVRNFFVSINSKDSKNAVKDFADVITLQSQSFNMKKDELEMTIHQWCEEHDDLIPEYTDMILDQNEDGSYQVCVVFDTDFNFFIPMNNKKLLMGVNKVDNKFKIESIKIQQQQSGEQSSAKNEFLYKFVSAVLSNDFELVASYIYQDVWINEYQMLFPATEILDHLQNWYIDNVETTTPEEVVDFESVQTENEAALEMIQTLGANPEDFDIISFRLIKNTFLPGNPDKDTFSIIVGNNGVAQDKILGIAQ